MIKNTILVFSIFFLNTSCLLFSQINSANSQSFVDIKIEVYEHTAKIIVPEKPNIKIIRGYSIPVRIYLDYRTQYTKLGDFRLAIKSPGTTLVPVTIPPPPPPPTSNTSEYQFRRNSLEVWSTLYIDGRRLNAGNHRLIFSLEHCNGPEQCYNTNNLPPENLINSNKVDFEVVNNYDLSFAYIHIIPAPESRGFILKNIIQNRNVDPIYNPFKIKFYESKDDSLDKEDKLIREIEVSGINSFSEKTVDLFINRFTYRRLINKYIICELDAYNEIAELNEFNNVSDFLITPINNLDIRSYNKPEISVSKLSELESFELKNIYPNPFRDQITFTLDLQSDISKVSIKIFDIYGQLINTISPPKILIKGKHALTYSTISLSTGIYFYSIEINEKFYTGKILK